MSQPEVHCKIISQHYKDNGDLISKFECGAIACDPKRYPDGLKPPTIWNCPCGIQCDDHNKCVPDQEWERQ